MAVDVTQQHKFSNLKVNEATSPKASTLLLHELQFGEQLNQCIHQARRADFSLMLAMLCDDVREQSQFILPQQVDQQKPPLSNEQLRSHFDLPSKTPLALENMAQISYYNQGKVVENGDLSSLNLANLLQPKPLVFRDNPKHISKNVMDNTTLTCQQKQQQPDTKGVLNKRKSMNVDGWLKNVQTSLVKSRLITPVAA